MIEEVGTLDQEAKLKEGKLTCVMTLQQQFSKTQCLKVQGVERKKEKNSTCYRSSMAWEGIWVHWWMEVDTDEGIGIGTFYVWKSVMNNFVALIHGDFI